MFRYYLLRGVSAGALALLCVSNGPGASALAQEALPAIDIDAAAADGGNGAPPPPSAPTRRRPQSGRPRWPTASRPSSSAFNCPTPCPASRARTSRKRSTSSTRKTRSNTRQVCFFASATTATTRRCWQTRTWGVNSSARSLVYADDLLLTALIGNDNTIGAPRWGLVSPEEIDRIDVLYGPFAAEFPGNALGGVVQITTRMPEKLEITAKETVALQDFSLWGTANTFHTNVQSFTVGDKVNDLSWFVALNWNHTTTQPLTFIQASSGTVPSSPANLYGYPGGDFGTTKFGVPATVLGSAGNLLSDYVNAKVKLAYDFTPTIRATYMVGLYTNDSNSTPDNYLVEGGGPYFGSNKGISALGNSAMQSFGAAYYRWQEKILTNAASVKSNTKGVFDWEVSASNFSYLQSDQVSPYSGAWPYGGYTQNGKDAVYTGTWWTLLDLKGIVRPDGYLQGHDISFGAHGDQFHLNNPTWLTTNWTAGTSASTGVVSSIGDGTTQTQALWLQDAWKINSNYKFTARHSRRALASVAGLQPVARRSKRDGSGLDSQSAHHNADLFSDARTYALLAQGLAAMDAG